MWSLESLTLFNLVSVIGEILERIENASVKYLRAPLVLLASCMIHVSDASLVKKGNTMPEKLEAE
jgi:hypothetical protein